MTVRCSLPPVCSCCQRQRFAYLPAWRYACGGRRPEGASETEPFSSGMSATQFPMLVATTRPAQSSWYAPTQENLPVSLRICLSCGAAQPYVDLAGLSALLDGAGTQAVIVDHGAGTSEPYR